MWNHPLGEWNNYTILLKDEDTTVDTQTLAHDAQECNFNNLMPGHTYTITVTTNSGDLSSSAHVTGRTSESFRGPVLCCCDGGTAGMTRVLIILKTISNNMSL